MSTPTVRSSISGEPADQEIEDQLLRCLAQAGLVVPTRDPHRPHTKTEQKCGKKGGVGVPIEGGRTFYWRPWCHSKGCEHCAVDKAAWDMGQIRKWPSTFVGKEEVCSSLLVYPTNADKLPWYWLWVTVVPTPPDHPGAVKERVNTRVCRLVRSGVGVECVLVPCDGVTVIVSTADLAEARGRGRKQVAPTSGRWLPTDLVLDYLERTLASTAVNGRVWWTKGWKPEDPPKKAYAVTGEVLITKTAHRILISEGYEFDGPSVWEADPVSVLLDAKRRAERFWADPRCDMCATAIAPKEPYWWRDGQPLCGICDLALDLDSILVRGLTEREIEAHIRPRKLSFKRKRSLIEQALTRAGAEKLPSGIWMREVAGEEVV